MRPSRSLARSAFVLAASLCLTACAVAPAPIAPSPSSLSGRAAPTDAPSVVALVSVAPSAPATATVTPISTATPSVEPTPEPTIDPGTAGPGCGTGQAGLFAHNDEVPKTLQFGHATIEFTNISVSMRNGTYDASDSVPGGIGLTPDEIAVVVGPDDHIILRAAGVTLRATSAQVVPWSTVEFSGGLASSPADRVDLPWRVRSDGSLSISAPSAVGDYEVELGPDWTGTCIAGGGIAYSRIKVR